MVTNLSGFVYMAMSLSLILKYSSATYRNLGWPGFFSFFYSYYIQECLFSLTFSNLIILFWRGSLWVFILLGGFWATWLCRFTSIIKLGTFWPLSLPIFSVFLLSLSYPGTPTLYVCLLDYAPGFLRLDSLFTFPFSFLFLFLRLDNFNCLYSSLIILSYACANL